MASTTPNIGLYKKDPVADANDYFNIQTMLNNNWDALDTNQGSLAALRTALGLGATASIAAILGAMNTLISTAQSTADGRAKIATGSYTGTGTYGSDNPNSLAFSFAPKLVLIRYSVSTPPATFRDAIFSQTGPTLSTSGGFNGTVTLSNATAVVLCKGLLNGTSMSWYNSDSADKQMNASGDTYYYLAFG